MAINIMDKYMQIAKGEIDGYDPLAPCPMPMDLSFDNRSSEDRRYRVMDIFENMEQQNPMVLARDTLDHLFSSVVVEVKLEPGAKMPTKAHAWDAGFDLYAPRSIYLAPGTAAAIDTGVHMCIPHGYVGMIKSKSGLNVKHGVSCEGVIDAGYTGTIVAKLYNNGRDSVSFTAGDKITQIVILPIPEVELIRVDALGQTERGDNGFGSSGR